MTKRRNVAVAFAVAALSSTHQHSCQAPNMRKPAPILPIHVSYEFQSHKLHWI